SRPHPPAYRALARRKRCPPGCMRCMRLCSCWFSPPVSTGVLSYRWLALEFDIGCTGILARLIEFQHAAGRLEIEAAIFVFEIFKVLCRNPMILCAEKKQGHGCRP